MNMTLLRIRVPATLLEEARGAARVRGISVAALFREAVSMRLEVKSMADPIKQEIAAEIGMATQAIRDAGLEFYDRAADSLTRMANEREALGEIVNQLLGALEKSSSGLPTATPTSKPVSAVNRAPGSAPR
jgi:hypothetical protein